MNKKIKLTIIISLVAIISIAIITFGLSYAGFNFSFTSGNNMISTKCIKTSLSDKGSISMDKAIPMSDKEGLATDPYVYEIENKCDDDLRYFVTLNVMKGSNLDNLSKIKISLAGDSKLEPTIESSLMEVQIVDRNNKDIIKAYKLDQGTLKKGEKKSFYLRSWIDYDVKSITGKVINKVIVQQFEN